LLAGSTTVGPMFRVNQTSSGSASAAIYAQTTVSPNSNAIVGQAFASGGGISGTGVFGTSDQQDGVGVRAEAFTGAALQINDSNQTMPPTTGSWTKGAFVVTGGHVWYCYQTGSGTSSKWVKLSSTLVTLPSSVRVYDSRSGQPNQAPNTQGALTFTAAPPTAAFRDVACNKDAVSGTTVVPAGATALLMNLTVISAAGGGALAAFATGTAQPTTSSINWSSAGQVLANSVTSACNASQHVSVGIVASVGASANFILDVIGYYL
jgi:hypothetical protein